jgi:hypothetical protein
MPSLELLVLGENQIPSPESRDDEWRGTMNATLILCAYLTLLRTAARNFGRFKSVRVKRGAKKLKI